MGSLQLQFTIDDLERGERIAAELLSGRLVACAQTIGPVTSRYWWNGSIERAREWMFVCKTTDERVDAAIELIRAQHPYEVPEIVAAEITTAFAPYAKWIAAEVSSEA
jgi:periplasmic divalent cation tolerance protein